MKSIRAKRWGKNTRWLWYMMASSWALKPFTGLESWSNSRFNSWICSFVKIYSTTGSTVKQPKRSLEYDSLKDSHRAAANDWCPPPCIACSWPLCVNSTSPTKPEIHSLSHRPSPPEEDRATAIDGMHRKLWVLTCDSRHVSANRHRQTDKSLIAILHSSA